jgi:tetratricopeptide (TPR) repeat protein
MAAQPYFQHPLYPLAMQHLQEGDWRAGLKEIERLVELYPLEQELRSLRNEFNFKSHLDSLEAADQLAERRGRVRRLLLRLAAAVAILLAAYVTVRVSWRWMAQQVMAARQQVEQEIQAASISAMQRDVEALMHAGRLAEADALLGEISQLDPSVPGLAELSAELSFAVDLSDRYDEAMGLIDGKDWVGAKASLQGLEAAVPNYRDVSIQLAYIERQTLLGNLLSQGEAAFAEGNWEEAVTAFENLRALHPQHEPETIEARLFQSYVSAGRGVLIGQEDSLAALQLAESHFRKALALRPQDPEVKRERELAGLYLKAQDDFDLGNWSAVIEGLEIVIGADPSYAQGTARQTLYDAYAARGDLQMSVNLYDGALSDFERAVALAEQDAGAGLRLYEAHLKLAEVQGATGNFEAAVLHFRTAAELGKLQARAAQDNPAMLGALLEAERHAANGNFGVAFERYRRAMRLADADQVRKIHVVQEGEYLTLLAGRYGSTVQAIAVANGIEDFNLIFPGQELLIPVLP